MGKQLWRQVSLPLAVLAFLLIGLKYGHSQIIQNFSLSSHIETTNFLDVAHYLRIAEHGYRPPEGNFTGDSNVFFPVFPAMIWGIQKMTGLSFLESAFYLQKFCLLILLVVAWRWVQKQFGRETTAAKLALVSIFLHPAVIFLTVPYTETIALTCLFGCLWCWEDRKLFGLFLFVLCGALIRPTGMFLAPIAVMYWVVELFQNRASLSREFIFKSSVFTRTLATGMAVVSAFGLLMWLHAVKVGDPLSFLKFRYHWKEESGFANFAPLFQFDLGQNFMHMLLAWCMLIGSYVLWKERRVFEALICATSMLVFIYQDKWGDLARYSYAAIPAWMCLFRVTSAKPVALVGLSVFAGVWATLNMVRWYLRMWVG